jgi:diacylglycerol kinase family enzyme
MAPNAKFNDRKLSIFMIHGMSKMKLLFCLGFLFIGKKPKFKGVETFDCTKIEIKTSEKLKVHVDGKLAGTTNHLINTCYKDQIRMPK